MLGKVDELDSYRSTCSYSFHTGETLKLSMVLSMVSQEPLKRLMKKNVNFRVMVKIFGRKTPSRIELYASRKIINVTHIYECLELPL